MSDLSLDDLMIDLEIVGTKLRVVLKRSHPRHDYYDTFRELTREIDYAEIEIRELLNAISD